MNRLVARNVMVTLVTQIVSWGLTFAVTLYLPRYIGAAGLGQLAFASALVAVFYTVVPLGTSAVLVKEVARDHGRTGELLGAALLLRLVLGVLMGGLCVAGVRALGYAPILRLLVGLAAGGTILVSLNEGLTSALQGQEKMSRQGLSVVVEKVLSSGLLIGLCVLHRPLWMIASVTLLTTSVALAINLGAFRALLPTMRLPSWETLRWLAVAGLPFMGWTVFRTLYGQTDPIVLKFVANDVTVGWYAAAFRLVGTTLFFPTAITTALLPTLSRLHRESEAEFAHLARRSLALVMLFGVPIALVLICLPGRVIELLHYTKDFAGSIPVLRVGGVGVLLWFAGAVLGTVVIAADRQDRMFRASVTASVLGIPACALAAWVAQHFWHNGAVGAITSDVLLELYLLAAYLRMLPSGIFRGESLAMIGRYALASLPMGAALALLAGRGLWVVLPCALLYVGMCWLLRCLSPQDLAMARQALMRKAQA